jgi:hypothetical protein
MVRGAIAYQTLLAERPATIATVRTILGEHRWHDGQWKEKLEEPDSQRDEMMFMLATAWADDIRNKDKAQHREK